MNTLQLVSAIIFMTIGLLLFDQIPLEYVYNFLIASVALGFCYGAFNLFVNSILEA